MQIGNEGSAYGPSQVMSRPTLGTPIRPVPAAALLRARGGVLGAATRMPSAPKFSPAVLTNELKRRLIAARAMQPQGGAVVQHPLQVGGGAVVPPVPGAQQAPLVAAPNAPAFTADPSQILARARLAQMLGSGVNY